MNESIGQLLIENLALALCFLALWLISSWIAFFKGYYNLPFKNFQPPSISLIQVCFIFFIFFGIYLFLAPLFLFPLLQSEALGIDSISSIALLQFCAFFCTALLLFLYNLLQERKMMLSIWKDYRFPGKLSLQKDLSFSLLSWIISLPAVLAASHFFSIISIGLFGISEKEQVAVLYMKRSLESPLAAVFAFFSVLIAAPLLEEYLFRGILQSYLRKKFSPFKAICLSSFFFAFFHFAPSQGVANIPLIGSLFIFSCYLGFVYEKTRSLWSSIGLHVTFNLISVIRIIFT
jgi:membrane protease YdiL (CAAX protease family)